QTLRERKRRPSKPLAVMFPSLQMIQEAACVSEAEERMIQSKEHPIVIVKKKEQCLVPGVAPGIDRIGVFLPYTPLHLLLMEKLQRPIVATSANRSEEPIIIDADVLIERLGNVVDAVLDHDRAIVNACDDSVVMMTPEQRLTLRMARGYAPASLPLPFETPKKILALGANQKNAIALAFGKHAVLSPHIGDLGTVEANEYFERTVETFERLYDFTPDIVVCDLHPGYETTKWAYQLNMKNEKVKIVQVQHHYAHALSCMAEAGLDEEVLAFCFDGTGYGMDKVHPAGIHFTANGEAREGALGYKVLWGGEVLLADPREYSRICSLRPFRLLGGEKAIREPRRVALALLFECFSLEEVLAMENPTVESFEPAQIKTLHTMWERGLNAPLCSSVGRLFDAVASLTGVAQTLGYEGESGLLLEATAAKVQVKEKFALGIGERVIDWEPLLRRIMEEPSKETAAFGLHAALADAIADIATRYPDKEAVLSGGVFQNRTLVTLAIERLDAAGI
ncbi:MAG TPA: carbamoyltransferase HypF, partial [Sulfuricurvum sp.]|nr:carbamoyltransferase HypF [Sulfuricurvum sp.]